MVALLGAVPVGDVPGGVDVPAAAVVGRGRQPALEPDPPAGGRPVAVLEGLRPPPVRPGERIHGRPHALPVRRVDALEGVPSDERVRQVAERSLDRGVGVAVLARPVDGRHRPPAWSGSAAQFLGVLQVVNGSARAWAAGVIAVLLVPDGNPGRGRQPRNRDRPRSRR